MEIKKIDLIWKEPLIPLNLSKVDSIAYHHMAHPTADIKEVERWHLQRDEGTWKGFGYNWWIGKDGKVYEGRGLNVGAGVTRQNNHIINIGFQGDYEFTDKEMPKAQYDAGVWLTRKLMREIPTIRVVHGHKYWESTSCPGKYFPLLRMIEDAFKEELPAEKLSWKEILWVVADDPGGWEKAINNLATASENGMMNSIYRFLPLLIEKIYNCKEG